MPMIVPHQSQVGISTANGGQTAPYRSASAFMTPGQAAAPEGLKQLARGMDKLGGAVNALLLERQNMRNAADLLADKIAYEDALRDFDSNYRQTHQGVSARDAEEAYAQFHQEQYRRLQEKWGGNPWLMQGVNRMAEGIRQPSMQRAVNYRDQQEQFYQKSVLDSSEAHALELFADPSCSMAEKEAALQDHERSLRMFAGQRPVMVDGRMQWQGGRNIDAELMSLRQKAAVSNIEGLLAAKDYAGAERDLAVFSSSGQRGDRVAQFESGGQGVRAIGYDKNGGTSYGKYQLSSKQGSYQEWLDYLGKQGAEGAVVAGRLKAAGGFNTGSRSGAAVEAYRKEAEANPELFERTQREYVEQTHYGPMLAKLPAAERAMIEGNAGLQEMAWSVAVQHGGTGGAKLLSRAWKDGMTDGELVDAVYAARGGHFGSSTPEVQASVQRRFGKEAQLIRGMLRQEGTPGGMGQSPLTPQQRVAYSEAIETGQKKQAVDDFLSGTMDMPAPERLAQLDRLYGNDPDKREMYDAIRQGIMHDANAKESMRNIERRDRKLASLKEMEQAANLPPEQSYQKMQEIGQRLPLEERADFYKAANNLRNPGYYDDPWAVQEITDRLANGEEVNIRAEYGSRLTPKTAKRFAEQAFRTALPAIKTAFDDVANEWLATEKNKNHAKELGMANKTALWTRFLAQTDADEKKDYARLRQEAADFFKKVTLERGWFNRDVETVQGLEGSVLDKYDDARPMQGTAEYGIVVDLLKNAGVKPDGFGGGYSDAQLSAGYRQYRDMQKGGKE